ncbi:MAG TPA: hypothetical protein VFQ89_05650, partial [Candidatus Binatia bacterium]|nr:hypothetical protein [Candidatus Binatia bacterium]
KALPTPPAMDIWAPKSGPRGFSLAFLTIETPGTIGTFGTSLWRGPVPAVPIVPKVPMDQYIR